jgi:hypothetical protein
MRACHPQELSAPAANDRVQSRSTQKKLNTRFGFKKGHLLKRGHERPSRMASSCSGVDQLTVLSLVLLLLLLLLLLLIQRTVSHGIAIQFCIHARALIDIQSNAGG